MQKAEYYNYIYLDPRKPGRYCYDGLSFSLLYEPFYVGKGKARRKLEHIKLKIDKHNRFKSGKIINILNENYNLESFVIQCSNNIPDICAKSYEMYLIQKIGRYNKHLGPLTNLTDGGDGLTGFNHSEESKLKIKANRFDNSKIPGIGEKRAAKIRGRKHTDNQKQNMKAGRLKAKKSISCLNCRKEFLSGQSTHKFCSATCRDDYSKKDICLVCGKTFHKEPYRKDSQNTCSRKCHFELLRKNSPNFKIVNCPICGKEHFASSKTCSKACSCKLGHLNRQSHQPRCLDITLL